MASQKRTRPASEELLVHFEEKLGNFTDSIGDDLNTALSLGGVSNALNLIFAYSRTPYRDDLRKIIKYYPVQEVPQQTKQPPKSEAAQGRILGGVQEAPRATACGSSNAHGQRRRPRPKGRQRWPEVR